MTSDDAKQKLRLFLKEQKIEQKTFAQLIGKSEVTVSRWLSSGGRDLTNANIKLIAEFINTQSRGIKAISSFGELMSEQSDAFIQKMCDIAARLALDLNDSATQTILEYWRDMSVSQRYMLLAKAAEIKEENKTER